MLIIANNTTDDGKPNLSCLYNSNKNKSWGFFVLFV